MNKTATLMLAVLAGCLAFDLKADGGSSSPTNAFSPSTVLVEPLLSTAWSQWTPYNLFCPPVTNAMSGYGGRAPTGCVPVAMAQLLRYYSWPPSGIGTNQWTDTNGNSRGTYSANWAQPIAWPDMKDSYEPWCPESPDLVNPLAELMAQLGVAANTDYEADASGANVLTLVRNLAPCLNYSLGELVVTGDVRFSQILQKEISQHRPVLINMRDGEGHTGVADGLGTDHGVQYVHINFGEGGQEDGWYVNDGSTNAALFEALISTFHPNNSGAFVTCAPNFFECAASNNWVSDQTLRVFAAGTNTVSYTLASSAPWLRVLPDHGVAGTNAIVHQISLGVAQVPPGTNDAWIDIHGSAPNLPRRVRLRLYKPDPPLITQQPAGAVTLQPVGVVLAMVAAPGQTYQPCGPEDTLNYQWFRDGARIDGATNSFCYSIGYGTYYCQVIGLGGQVQSSNAAIEPVKAGSRVSVTQVTHEQLLVEIENVQSGHIAVEYSSNLRDWAELASFAIAPNEVLSVWIPFSAPVRAQFFRLRE